MLVTGFADGKLQLVWGRTGHATALSLSPSNGAWTLDSPLVVGEKWTSKYALCTNTSTLESATFIFAGEGADRTLAITGEVASMKCYDDYKTPRFDKVSLTGTADHRRPIAYGPSASADPCAGLSISLDKPMAVGSTATITPSGGPPFTMVARTEAGTIVGFDSDVLMPLGQSFHAEFGGLDLAGVGCPSDIDWSTLPDFGVLATDGFESGSTSGIKGGTIVDSYGVPALSGEKMLRVSPGTSTLLHLAAAPAAKRLLLDIRVLNECSYRGFKTFIAVKAGRMGSGGAQTLNVEVDTTTTATVGSISFGVGELRSLTIPLPSVEGDVLVQFLGDNYQGAGCKRAGALVDNVRLE